MDDSKMQDGIRLRPLSKISDEVMRLTSRSDFLKLNKSLKTSVKGFYLQGKLRLNLTSPSNNYIRVGFTCSKKVGNAVVRNRAKRRLRRLVQECFPKYGTKGWDYVLIAKKHDTMIVPFDCLKKSLKQGVMDLRLLEAKKIK